MKEYIKDRVLNVADYIIATKCTVRVAAKKFGVSKSTIHKDMKERLRDVNAEKYVAVDEVLQRNKEERHLRGGIATKMKYLEQSEVERYLKGGLTIREKYFRKKKWSVEKL